MTTNLLKNEAFLDPLSPISLVSETNMVTFLDSK